MGEGVVKKLGFLVECSSSTNLITEGHVINLTAFCFIVHSPKALEQTGESSGTFETYP